MVPDSSRKHAAWFMQDLTRRILPLWLKLAPEENGFFHTQFDREWNPGQENSGTLVSQSRMIFTMATGYALTGHEKYRAAARNGIEFLERAFRDHEASGYFWSATADGATIEDTKRSYGHAFVIFAYANAATSLKERSYAETARGVWKEYRENFTHKNGGFANGTSRRFEPDGEPLSQNPIMHLFESLIALGSIPGYEDILEDASEIANFVTGTLIDEKTGFLPELFDSRWHPIPESAGNRIEVGHAFEWAFLLSYAVGKGLPERLLSYAHQFLDAGLTLGFDQSHDLVFSPATLNGARVMKTNSYWDQCEAIRALLHFAVFRERPELLSYFDSLASNVRAHYVDEEFGGWYASLTPKGTPQKTEKGSVWKLDYHQTSMTLEMKRIIELS